MSFATHFARALIPAALIVAPAAAPAAVSPDVAKVEQHLKSAQSMTANFVQKDGKGQTASGTLQMKRPGRVRFEYSGGDMLLVADGKKLTFVDYAVGQKSGWDLSKTPLGVLLGTNANVRNMIRVIPDKDQRILLVRARDVNRPEYGTLILAFVRDSAAPGGLRLYGWTAIDAQNKKTTVSLSNVRYNVAVPAKAFTYAEPKKR